VSIQIIVACPAYTEKFILNNVVALFIPTSVVTPGFQHYITVPVSVPVAVSVAVSVTVSVTVTVSVKTVSVPAVPYAVAGACARQWRGRHSFPRKRVGGALNVLATYGTAGAEK